VIPGEEVLFKEETSCLRSDFTSDVTTLGCFVDTVPFPGRRKMGGPI
jgi:hypothetical protein